ncbi:MAG: AMP-binding protein [Proteobacteria bacterium]|nr:AMP-binding protein [Pseudomonadota bacterium]MDA1357584.1 AMP-binding protein [Pseudomonadota bacterium]
MADRRPPQVRSALVGMAWPGLPARHATNILALLYQLEHSQWLPAEDLLHLQFRQINLLFRHAVETVPYYRARRHEWGIDFDHAITLEEYRQRVPILTRAEVQRLGDDLLSEEIPPSHGKSGSVFTSGSTGMPIKVIKTELTEAFWNAFTVRDHLWHRDPNMKLASIRPLAGDQAAYPDGNVYKDWGGMAALAFATGPSAVLNIGTRIQDQVEWLQRYDPDYILTYPANIQAIAIHCERHKLRFPRLKLVHTMADLLRPEVRKVCRDALDVPVVDIYSSAEIGYIALQCPESENLHIQSESVFVEVLDAAGRPCALGEVGQIVTTPLHNFAMPLMRYAVGDYAEVGSCPCGRTLPVLSRIMGRARSMVRLPNGDQFYVNFLHLVMGFDAIRQFQIVRRASEALEMKLVATRRMNASEELRLTEILRERFRHPFAVSFSYHDEIPRSAGGKFEDYKDESEP